MAPYAGGVYTWDPYPISGSPQFESTARSTLTEWKTNSESMEARLTAFDDGSGFVTNTIPGATIVTGSVSDTQLATDSVIEVKIAAGAVTNTKLADTAVSTTKMSDQAVTPAKIDTNGQALSDLDVLRYNSTTLKFDPVPIGAAGDTYEVKKNAGDTPGFLDDQIVGYLVNSDNHIADVTTNPHFVTKSQVGLGSVIDQGKSDTFTDDTGLYATSKAVYDAIRVNDMHDHTDFLNQAEIDARVNVLMDYSQGLNGYQKFPNGIIVQYGYHAWTGVDTNIYISFPILFPSVVRSVICTAIIGDTAVNFKAVTLSDSISNASFRAKPWDYNGTETDASFYWVAWGY